MYNNLTDYNGYFDGWTTNVIGAGHIFPDFIVAISNYTVYNEQTQAEQLAWLIEFQCLWNKARGVYYLGINAECYTPHPSDQLKQEIYDAAVDTLNVYATSPLFFEISQDNCSYPF